MQDSATRQQRLRNGLRGCWLALESTGSDSYPGCTEWRRCRCWSERGWDPPRRRAVSWLSISRRDELHVRSLRRSITHSVGSVHRRRRQRRRAPGHDDLFVQLRRHGGLMRAAGGGCMRCRLMKTVWCCAWWRVYLRKYGRPLWTYSSRLQRVLILLQRVVDTTTTRSNSEPFIGRSDNA